MNQNPAIFETFPDKTMANTVENVEFYKMFFILVL